MEFIDKFRASANRAKLVQSRIKAVEKMDLEAPEPVVIEQLWRFSIPNPEPLGRPIISIDDVWFDYTVVDDASGSKKPKEEMILQQVNFGVDLDSRIGILGRKFCLRFHLNHYFSDIFYLISLCWDSKRRRQVYTAQPRNGSIETQQRFHISEW